MDDLEPVFTVSNTYFYIAVSRGTPSRWLIDGSRRWQA